MYSLSIYAGLLPAVVGRDCVLDIAVSFIGDDSYKCELQVQGQQRVHLLFFTILDMTMLAKNRGGAVWAAATAKRRIKRGEEKKDCRCEYLLSCYAAERTSGTLPLVARYEKHGRV